MSGSLEESLQTQRPWKNCDRTLHRTADTGLSDRTPGSSFQFAQRFKKHDVLQGQQLLQKTGENKLYNGQEKSKIRLN